MRLVRVEISHLVIFSGRVMISQRLAQRAGHMSVTLVHTVSQLWLRPDAEASAASCSYKAFLRAACSGGQTAVLCRATVEMQRGRMSQQ